jgi:hypothetical protein
MAQTERIIAARAQFSALWWDDPRLGVWIGTRPTTSHSRRLPSASRASPIEWVICYRPPVVICEQLIDPGPDLHKRHHSHRNSTIIHGNAHVWNVFLPRRDGGDDVRIFDWDSWRIGAGTDDLAYVMAPNGTPITGAAPSDFCSIGTMRRFSRTARLWPGRVG